MASCWGGCSNFDHEQRWCRRAACTTCASDTQTETMHHYCMRHNPCTHSNGAMCPTNRTTSLSTALQRALLRTPVLQAPLSQLTFLGLTPSWLSCIRARFVDSSLTRSRALSFSLSGSSLMLCYAGTRGAHTSGTMQAGRWHQSSRREMYERLCVCRLCSVARATPRKTIVR